MRWTLGQPRHTWGLAAGLLLGLLGWSAPGQAQTPRPVDDTVDCEVLVVGGGLAGTATAYESLLAGRTVCLTEITDWLGGQITSQGTSAFDEAKRQRELLYYPRGYNDLRRRIEAKYGQLNPGDCWVSVSCFIPRDAKSILMAMLEAAAEQGGGTLKWFPHTVIKDLQYSADGRQITGAIAIQHQPAPGTAPLHDRTLSQIIEDAYDYANSAALHKTLIQFVPAARRPDAPATGPRWLVVEATETGELVALADVPYRLGLDPRSPRNPSSPTETGDPYCTQGFTYTFAMEQTATPQPQTMPPFYPNYEPYYGYDTNPDKANFNYVFTYRRIWAPNAANRPTEPPFRVATPAPGDISMQNWVWGNDYRPGTAQDNLIYTRGQLAQTGQLAPGGWRGGLRTDALRKGEEIALGFYYWLVAGTTDSQLDPSQKVPMPNHRLLKGEESPMGTGHGLSKYPYIREARRIIGRPSYAYPNGFRMFEIDISEANFREEYYQNLGDPLYRQLWVGLAGLDTTRAVEQNIPAAEIERRTRSRIFPDAVGIAQYAIDFHPCMRYSPPEMPGNIEYPGVRQAHGRAYPGQIPLRAMIPQRLDNLLVAGKSIAMSYSVAAAYRVHSFEWSVGAAAGTVADYALERGLWPYQLTAELPWVSPELEDVQRRLQQNQNPTAFPDTSIFNLDWQKWRVW